MTIGKRIRTLRHMREYPQSFLADAVGIKKQTLYKYENDIITNIPIDNLISIANALGVSPSYLIGCNDEEPESSWVQVFRDRLGAFVSNADASDVSDASFNLEYFQNVADGEIPITLKKAYDISKDIGVSFLYLCGIVDDENIEKPTPVSEDGLDDMERLFIQYVRDLTSDQQQMLLAQMQVMKESQKEVTRPSAQE
ncbi:MULTISPECIES: helix-turn-helix domain-containing protein [Anaerotruncus]|jgi:transcriptional regulator with XRE-family HTH domain|uniref:Transcriptional repressor DicA n=1 Tax=Anaerotruncus colihominis TaxID=169435 RepID=A0A174TQC8_9FIRM|nr:MULTISPECIES: helix-turn-helix transcriptional regulator [Anaerotruncus]MCI8493933.1 helix-turn-helix transcriptional regulator [Anaerotruncus sp.]CUQ12303.1 transcriptional repressor DicA [Anaerotruncus colihominis]